MCFLSTPLYKFCVPVLFSICSASLQGATMTLELFERVTEFWQLSARWVLFETYVYIHVLSKELRDCWSRFEEKTPRLLVPIWIDLARATSEFFLQRVLLCFSFVYAFLIAPLAVSMICMHSRNASQCELIQIREHLNCLLMLMRRFSEKLRCVKDRIIINFQSCLSVC